MKVRRRLLIWIVVFFVLILLIFSMRGVPAPAWRALNSADQYELLELDPSRLGPDGKLRNGEFHGYDITRRLVITDSALRNRVNSALQSGARWNTGLQAMCFDPRHGVRVVHDGVTTDLVICFECSQVQVWHGNQSVRVFTTGSSPQGTLDEILKDAPKLSRPTTNATSDSLRGSARPGVDGS